MTRQIRIVKRDEKGQAAVLELDGGKDPAQRDAEQAHMIGQHVGHVVGSIVSEAVQHIDTQAEIRRIVSESERQQQEAARPLPPALGEVEAYNFERRKQRDAEWDALQAEFKARSDAAMWRLDQTIEQFRNRKFSWEQ